jgi:alkanesulfonate monooxygenase SsuD/methylene tetrahydromethanopterin reductase-like flavin-dependent oxidoreductase (luciferase family)
MSLLFAMRFDFRNPAFAGTTPADRYDAALEMAEWGERIGCISVVVSEHHGSPDGYLPSPLMMLAAMGARTTTVRLSVAALIAPFHDPLRLAEDLLVLDHLTRGRIDLIVAAGYVPGEFEMLGASMGERAKRVTETVRTVQGAFTGEPFEFRGRTVHLTPTPYGPGPSITLGGSSDPAARRAARLGVGFIPSVPAAWDPYRDEVQKLGGADPGPCPIDERNRIVALAEDPERGWAEMAPFFRHEMDAYGAWQAESGIASPYHVVRDLDELRETGHYAVLTPDEYVAELKAGPFPFALLHPLCGGMPIDLAWSSLRLFEHEVLPAFAD